MIKKFAFTLIELIIVISVIAILVLIAFPATDIILQQSRDSARISTFAKLKDALEAYVLEQRTLPSTAGCFNKTSFPDLESALKNGEYPVDPMPDNEIQIGGSGVCGGKNEYYYIPLSKGGIANKSFIMIADTERDKTNEEGYISSAAASSLQTMFQAGSGVYEDIITEVRSGTTETAKNNVYVVVR